MKWVGIIFAAIIFCGCVSTADMTDDDREWIEDNMTATARTCPLKYPTCTIMIWTDGQGNVIRN